MAEIVIDWYKLPTLLASLGLIAGAIIVYASNISASLQRRLALFLLLKGFFFGVLFIGSQLGQYGGEVRGYFSIALPFAALWLVLGLVRAPQRAQRYIGIVSLILCGGMLLDYALRPGNEIGTVADYVFSLSYLGFAVLAWVLWRVSLRQDGLHRKALELAAFGLMVEPFYMGAFLSWQIPIGLLFTPGPVLDYYAQLGPLQWLIDYGGMLTCLGLGIAMFWRGPGIAASPRVRSAMKHGVWIVPATALFVDVFLFVPGLVAHRWAWWTFDFFFLDVHWFIHALTLVVGMACVAGAIIHYQMFDIRLHIHGAVKQGMLAALALVVFVTTAEVLEQIIGELLETQNPQLASTMGAIPIALALAYLLHPVQRAASRLAGQVVPTEPMDAMSLDDRLALFQQQVHAAAHDGAIDERGMRMLDRLRQGLHLEPTVADPLVAEATT